MKIFSFLVILMVLMRIASLSAQDKKLPRLKIGYDQQRKKSERIFYKGVKRSHISWKELVPDEFLDFEAWKKDLTLKEQAPLWHRNVTESKLTEAMGRVLDCIGDCRRYRGPGFSNIEYLSTLLEGDEVLTSKDSYLWLFLFDGTLVRMSPNSSLSIKEINIGEKENFLHVRLNTGNILWLNRDKQLMQAKARKESDPLFLPLSLYEANSYKPEIEVNENDLYALIDEDQKTKKIYERLNLLIEENNENLFTKPTYAFLVFNNGTVFGKNISGEFIILLGDKSYFKLRDSSQLGYLGKTSNEASFLFRGFENKEEKTIAFAQWYEVGVKGRSIEEYNENQEFAISEFLTSNIPSILIARELMAKKYSSFAHKPLAHKYLALNHGFKLWTGFENNGELSQRLEFLKEYTRRSETTNLMTTEKFRKSLIEKGVAIQRYNFGPHFYARAMKSYYSYKNMLEGGSYFSGSKETLNSTKKTFWGKINARRK